MGVVAAFLALLFALTPSLEAVACAMEGCDLTCAEQSVGVSVSDADAAGADTCKMINCACVAGHCSHTALPAPAGFVSASPVVHKSAIPVAVAHALSAFPSKLERPPRA